MYHLFRLLYHKQILFHICKIKEVTWPDKCPIVRENCFINCTNLEKVEFNGPIESIMDGALINCKSLKEINFKNVEGVIMVSADFITQMKRLNVKIKTSNRCIIKEK